MVILVIYSLAQVQSDIASNITLIQSKIQYEKRLADLQSKLQATPTDALIDEIDAQEYQSYLLSNQLSQANLLRDYKTLDEARNNIAKLIDDCAYLNSYKLFRAGNRSFDINSKANEIMSACTPLEATKYNYVGDPSSGSSILTNLKNNLSQIKNNDPNFLTKVNYWLYSNFGDTSLVIGSIALDFQCTSLTTQITACSAASAAYYSVTKTLTDYNMGKTSVLDFGNLPMDTVTGALAGYVGSKTVNFILGGKAYTWFGGGKQVAEQTSSQFKLPANAQTTLEYIQLPFNLLVQ